MRKPVILLYSIIWATLSLISLSLISIGSISPAISAELRPLNLPSTQGQYNIPAPAQNVVPAPAPAPNVYDRFASVVEGLNETQKEEYRSRYQAELAEAQSRQDKTAEVYYQTLLDILN